MRFKTLLAVVSVSVPHVVAAQTDRDLGSHEHGSASLNIALDDDLVIIELESPWNNFVGFEHMPETAEQEALVESSLELLNQPEKLFSLAGGDCTFSDMQLESGIGMEEDHDDDHSDDKDAHHDDDHDDDEEEGHHDDDHDDEEDAHHDDDHDEDEEGHHDDDHDDEEAHHDDHGDETDSHSAVLVSYSFNCKDVTQLNAIDVNLFELWSGFEDLDVQLIGPGSQTLLELGPQQTRVDITQVQ